MKETLVKIRSFGTTCKNAYKKLKQNEPLVLSSSTAFFATFSLSPIVVLIVSLFSIYFQSETVRQGLFTKIASVVGIEAADDIESIVINFMEFEAKWWLNIAGLVFFVFIGTTLLNVIKLNIQKLWRIRKVTRNVRNQVKERTKFLLIILFTGILFMLSVLIDSALAFSLDYLQTIIPAIGIILIRFFNFLFALIVIAVWFTVLFKFIPHAKVDWDVAFNGAFLTAILFYGGRFLLGKVLVHARIESIFGVSASFALVMLFIFYSSFILYYGAAFTYEYGESINKHICAGKHAKEYEERFLGAES